MHDNCINILQDKINTNILSVFLLKKQQQKNMQTSCDVYYHFGRGL